MAEAVIFDFDGTMADFENTDTECLKLILKQTGAEAIADSFVTRAIDHIMSFHAHTGQRFHLAGPKIPAFSPEL